MVEGKVASIAVEGVASSRQWKPRTWLRLRPQRNEVLAEVMFTTVKVVAKVVAKVAPKRAKVVQQKH